MGAVFALFAAWYFWSPKAEGLTYNDRKGRLHFWGLFIGVIEKLAQSLVKLNKILFDTRKSYLVLNKSYLNYIKDYYSVNSIYFHLYQFKFINFLFKFFTLTNNNPNAQLVEVKNSVYNNADIQKASQRLNTKDIQWLVGFTDGDGYFTKYQENTCRRLWRHEYSIKLSIKDIRLLYKIKKILGCGVIRKYNNVAVFHVKKIRHIIYNVFPIFDKYPLLTERRRFQYIQFRHSLINVALEKRKKRAHEELFYIQNLVHSAPYHLYGVSIEDLLKNIDNTFFNNWLVGFTEAVGNFYFVKENISNVNNISQDQIPIRA